MYLFVVTIGAASIWIRCASRPFTPRRCAYERKLGGHFADIVLVQAMLEDAEAKIPGTKKSTKALRKLMNQAQKSKLVLSSNKETLFQVPSLYDDKDFAKSISRSTFEEMLTKEGWFERIPKVLCFSNSELERILF